MQPLFTDNPPLSLYIHIPWCVKKCPYCDFNSHAVKGEIDEQAYLEALTLDLQQDLPLIWGRRINSIFIGGGTPSLLSPEFYEQLFSNIRSLILIQPGAEITLEANPGTAEASRFLGYFQSGINRISLGVQSFDDQQLQSLGRIHNSSQVFKAYDMAINAGFKRINLDLMYGLPQQSVEQGLHDLQQAINLKPQHISWYQLTLEPNTVFYANPPQIPEEDSLETLMNLGLERLQQNDYHRYEVSAFCQSGEESRHNLNYWQFGDYLGIGAGAHSKITYALKQQILRRHKFKQPRSYMDNSRAYLAAETEIETQEIPLEFMLNALRLIKGVPVDLFAKHSGLPANRLDKVIRNAQKKGLMENWPTRIQTTALGLNYLNDTLSYFFSEEFEPFKNTLSKENIIQIKQI